MVWRFYPPRQGLMFESCRRADDRGFPPACGKGRVPLLFWAMTPNLVVVELRTPSCLSSSSDVSGNNVTTDLGLGENCSLNPLAQKYFKLMYSSLFTKDVFEAACDFAREYNSLLWEDSKKMRLIVKTDIFVHMKEFLNHKK
ncbi:RNA polymerase II transcription factor B subunit 2 [Tanacetum coccineum]